MKVFYEDHAATLYLGDVRAVLRSLPDESVQTCVTSPPYWSLRDYGIEPSTWGDGWRGALGLEPTPALYVAHMVEVFREVRRVLRPDGTLWLNLGDTYAAQRGGTSMPAETLAGGVSGHGPEVAKHGREDASAHRNADTFGLKHKDLVGIPWRVAFALQEDGWWLRQDIIWSKPNPMPESVTDRCTKAHEYVFVLSKNARYYWDASAIAEATVYPIDRPQNSFDREQPDIPGQKPQKRKGRTVRDGIDTKGGGQGVGEMTFPAATRNKRSVWTVPTSPFPEAHFATFPPDLITPMVLAGAPVDGVVLDPFVGSGTTAVVAKRLGRRAIGIDLNDGTGSLDAARRGLQLGRRVARVAKPLNGTASLWSDFS